MAKRRVAAKVKRAFRRSAKPGGKPSAAALKKPKPPRAKDVARAIASGEVEERKGKNNKESRVPAAFIQPKRWPRDISLERVVKRRDMGDVEGLAKSIDARGGLLQPIAIMHDAGTDYLIAGQRRLAAWSLSKFRKEPIDVHLIDVDSILAGEWDENAQRKDFTPTEQVDMYNALLPVAAEKAKERQRAGRKSADAGEAKEHIARYLGRDRKTIEKAKEVVDAARAAPKDEQLAALVAAMDKSGKVSGPWKRLQIINQVADIKEKKKNGQLDLPAGKFDRMVIDYPWPHEPGREKEDRATRPYATMPIAAGCSFLRDVGKRLAKDATVYFWTTSFHAQFAYVLLRAMGLTVVGDAKRAPDDPTKGAVNSPTIIYWVKDEMGRGQRLREKVEQCIVAIKGSPVWQLTDQTTELRGPSGENSEKPQSFYDLIDQVSPAQRTLSVFERRSNLPECWVGWGDQVGSLGDPPSDTAADELKALSAIAAGEPFNGAVIKRLKKEGAITGRGKLRLTRIGEARLEVLKHGATKGEKADHDFERLRQAAAGIGHEVQQLADDGADADAPAEILGCQCGVVWRYAAADGAAAESTRSDIAGHLREVTAAAGQAASLEQRAAEDGAGEVETFGNIRQGLLRVLGAIEAGQPIAFNDNDQVVRGLTAGKKDKRRLTKKGIAKLADLRAEEVRRFDDLRERGAAVGHELTCTLEGDPPQQQWRCQCGFEGDGGHATRDDAETHLSVALSVAAARSEAAAEPDKVPA